METKLKFLPNMFLPMDQPSQQVVVPLEGCSLLIKLEEDKIPQKDEGTYPYTSLKPPSHI
jgi:hypothetical protein